MLATLRQKNRRYGLAWFSYWVHFCAGLDLQIERDAMHLFESGSQLLDTSTVKSKKLLPRKDHRESWRHKTETSINDDVTLSG